MPTSVLCRLRGQSNAGHVGAQYGTQLEAIAHEVQQRAIAELRAKTGLHDVTVNVTIDDVII